MTAADKRRTDGNEFVRYFLANDPATSDPDFRNLPEEEQEMKTKSVVKAYHVMRLTESIDASIEFAINHKRYVECLREIARRTTAASSWARGDDAKARELAGKIRF